VEGIINDRKAALMSAIDEFDRAMKQANVFLEKGTDAAATTGDSVADIRRHLQVIAQNLEKASDNLNKAIEILADQPSQLLFGDPPPPRPVEPDGNGP
jgi:phospholipid/cholesterol/gamma-HCH transport system substrate-binding protein